MSYYIITYINPSEGLGDVTRLICRRFDQNITDVETISDHRCTKIVLLPRIPFVPIVNEKHIFPFKITQFPIYLCFAMTINIAQGQTLDNVGIYLPELLLSWGTICRSI